MRINAFASRHADKLNVQLLVLVCCNAVVPSARTCPMSGMNNGCQHAGTAVLDVLTLRREGLFPSTAEVRDHQSSTAGLPVWFHCSMCC